MVELVRLRPQRLAGARPRGGPCDRGASALLALALALAGAAGTAPAASGQEGRFVDVAASGDLLLHQKVVRAAAEQASGWAGVFQGLAEALAPGDVALVNLETPLADDVVELRSGTPPILGAPPEAAAGLAAAGVDVVSCANNHAYDQRAEGLARTLGAARAAGLRAIGAGRGRDEAEGHVVVERGGVRVALLATTEVLNRGPGSSEPEAVVARHSEERMLAAIGRARADAELVVLAVHWSHDFARGPRPEHRRVARRWVRAGVDLVLGTGPHVLHPVEVVESPRGQAVIAYSLGNLVSNQGKRYRVGRPLEADRHPSLVLPAARDGIVLHARMRLEGASVRVGRLEATPLWTHNNFWDMQRGLTDRFDIRVRRLRDLDEATRADRVPAIRAALGGRIRLAL